MQTVIDRDALFEQIIVRLWATDDRWIDKSSELYRMAELMQCADSEYASDLDMLSDVAFWRIAGETI